MSLDAVSDDEERAGPATSAGDGFESINGLRCPLAGRRPVVAGSLDPHCRRDENSPFSRGLYVALAALSRAR